MKQRRDRKISAKLQMYFRDYVDSAKLSADNLEFLLQNLGHDINLDYSVQSLVELEAMYRKLQRQGIPKELSDLDHFASLLGQYLGECIMRHTSGKWLQCQDRNHLFGQPCLDGFGNEKWDRVYPVDLVTGFDELPNKKPFFPGVRKQRVLARQMEKALEIFQKTSGVKGDGAS